MLRNIENLGSQLLFLSISIWVLSLIGDFGKPSVIIGSGLFAYGLLNIIAYVYRYIENEGFICLVVSLKETLLIGFGYSYIIDFEQTMDAKVWLAALVIYMLFTFEGNDRINRYKLNKRNDDIGDRMF